MAYKIAVMGGDGIGPEVVEATIKVLEAVGKLKNIDFEFTNYLIGGAAYDAVGHPLPQETIDGTKSSDAVLLGAVGGYQYDNLESKFRPEKALLGIRAELELFANLRPAVLFDELADACPLKPELTEGGLDILVIRELTGGIYFGEKDKNDFEGYDIMKYSRPEINRIAHVAFKAAMKRDKNLFSVDKENVLETSKVWRAEVLEVAKEYPEVELSHLYVDNAAMQLVRNPSQFDVIVTGNMFGDILSDEAAMITGSIGMLPSASLGTGSLGMYEPVHGSAPDIAGKGIANPMATILSSAMMLRYSLDEEDAALLIEDAVKLTINKGFRTADIAVEGETVLSTNEITAQILKSIGEVNDK